MNRARKTLFRVLLTLLIVVATTTSTWAATPTEAQRINRQLYIMLAIVAASLPAVAVISTIVDELRQPRKRKRSATDRRRNDIPPPISRPFLPTAAPRRTPSAPQRVPRTDDSSLWTTLNKMKNDLARVVDQLRVTREERDRLQRRVNVVPQREAELDNIRRRMFAKEADLLDRESYLNTLINEQKHRLATWFRRQ